jgi:hypothetical protein
METYRWLSALACPAVANASAQAWLNDQGDIVVGFSPAALVRFVYAQGGE